MADESIDDILRRTYKAYAEIDLAAIDALLSPEVVFHVPGRHPLAGTYEGKAAVFEYLGKVAAISGGRGGFEVHAITSGEGHGAALVVGTIYLGDDAFVRPTVHVVHVADGQITEFWEASLDQHAEDEFWIRACA